MTFPAPAEEPGSWRPRCSRSCTPPASRWPGEVRDHLDDGLAYTTVVTILSRLHAKGVLHRHKAGRAYLYAPVADEPGLAARRMARVLDAEADREAVLARFVSGLSGADEELLRRMLGDVPGSAGRG